MPVKLHNTSFETERLLVRSCQMEDAAELQALMTPAISAWVATWPTPLSRAATQAILSECMTAAKAGHSFAGVIEEKETSTPVGWLKLDITPDDGTQAGLGYWIGEASQRRGYALEVSKAAIAFAFSRLGVSSIRAGAQVENESSLSLLQKLGMTRQGVENVWAPARQRHEACAFWIVHKEGAHPEAKRR